MLKLGDMADASYDSPGWLGDGWATTNLVVDPLLKNALRNDLI